MDEPWTSTTESEQLYHTLRQVVALLAPWDKPTRVDILAMVQDILGKLTPAEHQKLMDRFESARHVATGEGRGILDTESKAILDALWERAGE